VAQHDLARLGHAQRARLAVDQARADLALEARDLLRDGRLGVGQRVRRGGEGAAQRHLSEDSEQPQILHNASLSQ
jgi:hypothetical protein